VAERILVALASIAVPLVGLALQATRRHRLVTRIQTYNALGKDFEAHDASTAQKLRDLAKETAELLVETERASLHRRFDPIAIFTFFLLASPGFVGIIVLWPLNEWWEWVLAGLAASYVFLIGAAAKEQLWKPRAAQESPNSRSAHSGQ
jgi:hypothetical protein